MEANTNTQKKKEVFIIRLTENDKQRLSHQAKEQNLSMSSYVRTKLLNNKNDDSKTS